MKSAVGGEFFQLSAISNKVHEKREVDDHKVGSFPTEKLLIYGWQNEQAR